jgi:uncharacterized membrane protein
MIVFGVFLLVVVAVVSVTVFFRGGDTVHIDLHWFTIKTSAGMVFLAGAVALALVVLALSLIWEGLKRARRRRKETKELRQRAAANDRIAQPRGSGSTGATTAGPAGTGAVQPRGPDDHFDSAPRDG